MRRIGRQGRVGRVHLGGDWGSVGSAGHEPVHSHHLSSDSPTRNSGIPYLLGQFLLPSTVHAPKLSPLLQKTPYTPGPPCSPQIAHPAC